MDSSTPALLSHLLRLFFWLDPLLSTYPYHIQAVPSNCPWIPWSALISPSRRLPWLLLIESHFPLSALNLRGLVAEWAECGLWSQTEFSTCGATCLGKTSEPPQALVSYSTKYATTTQRIVWRINDRTVLESPCNSRAWHREELSKWRFPFLDFH